VLHELRVDANRGWALCPCASADVKRHDKVRHKWQTQSRGNGAHEGACVHIARPCKHAAGLTACYYRHLLEYEL